LQILSTHRPYEPRSGELKGIMDARSQILTTYIQDLNALAGTIVQQVNDAHVTGYNLSKSSGTFFFDPDKLKAGNMELSDAIKNSAANIAAGEGGKITEVAYPAGVIPAVGSPLDLKTVSPNYRNLVKDSVKITLADGSVLEEGAGKDYVVDYENGTISFVNNARYAPGDPIGMTFSYNTTGYGQNALNIAGLRLKASMVKDKDGNFTQSVSGYYSAVIGKMGIEKNQNSAQKDTKDFLISQMDAEQSSISGVSLDEEMTNMIKYENSYKASARFISTISQMMDVLLALGQ
jgi:flagellar hook-associated protein 1